MSNRSFFASRVGGVFSFRGSSFKKSASHKNDAADEVLDIPLQLEEPNEMERDRRSTRSENYLKEQRVQPHPPVPVLMRKKNGQQEVDPNVAELERNEKYWHPLGAANVTGVAPPKPPPQPPGEYIEHGFGDQYSSDLDYLEKMDGMGTTQTKEYKAAQERVRKKREEILANPKYNPHDEDEKSATKKPFRVDFVTVLAFVAMVFTLVAVSLYYGTDISQSGHNQDRADSNSGSPVEQNVTTAPSFQPTIFETIFPTASTDSPTNDDPDTTESPTVKPTTKSPTLAPTAKPTTKSPTARPTTKSPTAQPTPLTVTPAPTTLTPTISEDIIEEKATAACNTKTSDKKYVGMCVTEDFYARCDINGNLLFVEQCHLGIKCECEPFSLVLDRNPCSAQDGNSCDAAF